MRDKTILLVPFSALWLACGGGGEAFDDGLSGDEGGTAQEDGSITNGVTITTTMTGSGTTGTTGTTAGSEDTTGDTGAEATGSTGAETGADGSSGGGESSGGGSDSGGADDDTIYQIQNGTIGPGTVVDVDGVVVTGVAGPGFFAQEPAGGQYSGVWVHSGMGGPDFSALEIGDVVDLGGETLEFNGLTEIDITAGTLDTISTGNPAPSPDLVTIDGLANDGEPWEAVLVRLEGDLAVASINGLGEITVSDLELTAIVDDFIYDVPASGDFPGLATGASFTAVQGPLDFTTEFKIAVRDMDDLEGYQAP